MKLRDINPHKPSLEFQSVNDMPEDLRAVSELEKNRSAGHMAGPLFTNDELLLLNSCLDYLQDKPGAWPGLISMIAIRAANNRISAAGPLARIHPAIPDYSVARE